MTWTPPEVAKSTQNNGWVPPEVEKESASLTDEPTKQQPAVNQTASADKEKESILAGITSPEERNIVSTALDRTNEYFKRLGGKTPYQKMQEFDSRLEELNKKYDPKSFAGMTDESLAKVEDQYKKDARALAIEIGLNVDQSGQITAPENERKMFSDKMEFNLSVAERESKEANKPGFFGNLASSLASGYNKAVGAAIDMLGVVSGLNYFDSYKDLSEGARYNADIFKQQASKYDKTIEEYAKQGDLGKATGQAITSAVESLPYMIPALANPEYGVYVMGGMSGIDKYRELEPKNIPQWEKVYNSLSTGAFEAIFEKVGTGAILARSKRAMLEMGEKKGREAITNAVTKTVENSASKIGPMPEWVKEGLSEVATGIGQNLTDKVTINPDQNIGEGAIDNFVVGAIMGKAFALPQDVAKFAERQQAKEFATKVLDKLPTDMDIETKINLGWKIAERDKLQEAEDKLDPKFKGKYATQLVTLNSEIDKAANEYLSKAKVEEVPDLSVGKMDEVGTEQQKLDFLQEQGVKVPDGATMAQLDELYEAEKTKKVPETVETVDKKEKPTQTEDEINLLLNPPEYNSKDYIYEETDKGTRISPKEGTGAEQLYKAATKAEELSYIDPNAESVKLKHGTTAVKADKIITEGLNTKAPLESELRNFDQFDNLAGEGIFFSKAGVIHSTWDAGRVSRMPEYDTYIEADVSLKNALFLDSNNESEFGIEDGKLTPEAIDKIKKSGYDVIVSNNESYMEGGRQVLLLDKKAIIGDVVKKSKVDVVKEAATKLSSTENISPETQLEVSQKENIPEPTQEKVSDIQIQKSESQPTTIQETEKSLQNEKLIFENENLNLQKDETQQEVRGQETTGKEVVPEEKKIKEAAIKVADTLRKAKFVQSMDDLSKLSSDPTALLKVAWDGSVEAAAKAIELGGSVAQAVADGVKTLKESDWYKKLSDESKKIAEERFAKDIETHLKEQNYATETGDIAKDDIGKRSDGDGTREATETGGGDSETKSKKEKVRRSRYGTRVAFGKKTPKSVKEKYAKEKLYEYKEESHGTVDEAVDKYLAGATTEQAMKALHDNEIPRRVRTGIAVGLIKRLNEESTPLYQKGDKAAADKIMDDIVVLHELVQKEIATELGRDMSYLGSNRVMDLLGPYQTAELARRGLDKSRSEGMKKKTFKDIADTAKNDVEITKKKVIDEVIEKIVKPKETKVSPEIEKIRKERSSLIDQWKKARKSTAYSAVIPGLTQADIEFIPQLAASYIKEGFYQTKVLVKKIQRVLDREGIKVSDADLETLLPKEYEGKPLSEYQQAEDLKKASLSLANQIFGDVIDKKSPESDPIVRMVKTLFSKFKETQLDRKKVEGMSDLEKLAYAIREKEKYKSVWIEAKQKALDIIENNKNISDEQKETAIERIETAYKNATQFTFSQKLVTDLIREELSEMTMNGKKGVDIGEVVRDHYESKDIIKADLVKSLVEKAGLDEKQAKLLADAVDKAFSTLMTARIQGVLKKYMEKSTRKTTSKQKKGAEEIVHLASIGAFDNEKFREAFADMWGLPALDDADVKSIITQAEMITKIKSEAIRYQYKQQLLAKIANMQGMDWDALWDGFWYANVLSGFGTQTKNFLDAATASTVESMLYSGTKMSQISRWRKAYANALKGRGFSNARNTLRTGNHPFEFGTDAPKQAKRILDSEEALVRNKAAWKAIRIAARYSNSVFNLMMSNDALWNTVAYESILDALVTKDIYKGAGIKWWNRLSKEQKDELNQKIDEMLKITPGIRETIKKMVDQESEAFKQVQAGLGEKQTGFTEMQAKLREYEIMDEMRDKKLVEEARRLAQMTLGNINPYGTLGYLMSFVSSAVNTIGFKIYRPMVIKSEDGKYHFTVSSTESMTIRPLSKVIPFTRIITALASRALGWNPLVMGMRYKLGVGFLTSIGGKRTERFRRQLTDHEKKVILKKAIVLASAYSILYVMSGGDEPEDGWVRVTTNGTGDWTKNKQLEASGWRPYSIQFGDFSISYQIIYPLNGILGAFGYARDQQLYKGADKSFSSFMKLLGEGSAVSLAQVLFSTPMSGLNSVLDLMTNIFRGETGTASGQLTKLIANIGGGFVAPRVLKDMEATYDILAERSDIEGVTFWEKMSDKVPFVGRNFAGKVERIDMFGDPFKVKGAFAAVLERDTSRPTSDLARWITEEIKYYRPIPDINREKFILMEKGGETDLARPLTGGNNTEEWLWTEYNRKLGQLFKEKAIELKASGDTKEEIKKEFELAWSASAENGGIQELAKAYVLELSEAHPLDKP